MFCSSGSLSVVFDVMVCVISIVKLMLIVVLVLVSVRFLMSSWCSSCLCFVLRVLCIVIFCLCDGVLVSSRFDRLM